MSGNVIDPAALKIEMVEALPFDIPLREPFRIATMVSEVAQNVLVHVVASGGLDGWGEASPFHAITGETQAIDLAAAGDLRPLLLGRNPLEIASLLDELGRFLPHHPTLLGAIDMALHDLAAKAAGLPLYRFLGGRKRAMETDLTIPIGDPETAGEKARRALQLGFRIIKTKVGVSLADDLRRLTNIRAAAGAGTRIRIDANQGWRRMEAVRALEAFAPLDIEFCEQPVRAHDLSGLRHVSARAPIPVMADESLFSAADALRLVAADAAPYFNIKLSKSGGIRGAGKVAAVAEAGGIQCMMGCMLESRLGISAAAHFALAHEAISFFDLDSYFEHLTDPITGGARVVEGMVEVPEAPGIGARPDPEFLARVGRK
jgi:L-Ala-D/L-Glu epimerase / N-acetyl-D-glutamate racemase